MIAPLAKKRPSPILEALIVLLAALLLFAAQTALSQMGVWVANMFTYRAFDPHGAFAWISVHHIAQAVAAMMVMGLISLLFRVDFKLGLGERRMGMRIVARFALILAAYQIIMNLALMALGLFEPFVHPADARNVLGTLGFQLLLSGTSEELLFRAFPIALLSLVTQKTFHLCKGRAVIPLSAIIAAVLFSLAHINWSTGPFQLHYDPLQLLYALAMGVIQGWAYVKTGSVVYPMMMHGISNGMVTVIAIVMPKLF